ncbi:MAG: response regulator transcription factor [Bacteroidota bacterium]
MKHILLLEDDPNLGFVLKEHLELHGYVVSLCTNGVDGLAQYYKQSYLLCLVDVMMPKKDGFTFAREVRAKDQQTPIIFLTAKSLKEDRIEGLRIGADDYVTKPFSMEELILRITAVLKRSVSTDSPDENQTVFQLGMYTFDSDRQVLGRNGAEQKLTGKEAELLRMLCVHMNRTLERDVALKTIWGDDSYFNGRSMDVFVSKLRKYLQEDKGIELLNVHGKGYKLVVSGDRK